MSQTYIDFGFVKENASFERVLAHYNLETRGAGVQRSLCCPFHPDKRPSCRVELDKKIFHCFACEAKGNILEFVARLEGDADDLRGAAQKIAGICEIAVAPPRRGAAKAAEKRSTGPMPGRRANTASAETPPASPAAEKPTSKAGNLTDRRVRGVARAEDEVADERPINAPLSFTLKLDPQHGYLVERGVLSETIATFGLGYCSRGVMAGRLCVPIHNIAGELVAYTGRWPGEPPEGVERYLLPKRFEKSRVLFNLHRVRDAEHVVLVEGYWSVFRLHALGVPVVGLMGSSVSEEQLARLRERGTRRVTLLLDGDDAGRKACERALPAIASTFFVRAPVLPDGEKPDTLPEEELRALVDLS